MSELHWIHSNSFHTMLGFLTKNPSPRKMRLCACTALRRVTEQIEERSCHAAVEVAEWQAECHVGKRTLRAAHNAFAMTVEEARQRVRQDEVNQNLDAWSLQWKISHLPIVRLARGIELTLTTRDLDAHTVAKVAEAARGFVSPYQLHDPLAAYNEEIAQCNLIRDIFGNPFRPVFFSSDWRTDTAIALARVMYESREFSAMPILADALQDAGCDNEDILSHCRDSNQVHVRGCWVVDFVLGKE